MGELAEGQFFAAGTRRRQKRMGRASRRWCPKGHSGEEPAPAGRIFFRGGADLGSISNSGQTLSGRYTKDVAHELYGLKFPELRSLDIN